MTVLYNIGILIVSAFINIGSLFSSKLKKLKEGRSRVWKEIADSNIGESTIWIHAASLGEFEQGRPLIEAIKKRFPERKIVLTFFSPSGYEIRKDYELADYVFYLPADTRRNAQRFINAVRPEMVFFIKYEFWNHFISQLKKREIPVYGVSVIFRESQRFFRWYGGWFRRMLNSFSHLYLQDEASAKLLESVSLKNYSVAGDTRFDRVKEIADEAEDIDIAGKFSEGYNTIVAGSSWPADEKILTKYINESPDNIKLIIAPHEIDDAHIREIESSLKVSSFRITKPPENLSEYKVMIVDTMGMLAAIYRYGQVAYIGGGFGSGIHNVLEAATYGIPVIFGPEYKKFKEACDLVELGGGFEINSYEEFERVISKMWDDAAFLKSSGMSAEKYVNRMCGATSLIMKELF